MQVEEEKEAKRMARKEKGKEEEKRRKIRKKRRERKLSVEEPSNSEDEREGGSTDLSVSSEEEEEEIGEVQCLCVSKWKSKSMFAESYINCNSCSRDQHPWDQHPPDQLLIKVVNEMWQCLSQCGVKRCTTSLKLISWEIANLARC